MAGCALLVCWLGACSLGPKGRARALVEEIPAHPEAEYVGDFETSPPDDLSGVGVTYRSHASPSAILAFYQQALAGLGWAITQVHDPDDAAVPRRIIAEKRSWRCRLLIIPEPDTDSYLIRIWVARS